jgi:hypothetical protein
MTRLNVSLYGIVLAVAAGTPLLLVGCSDEPPPPEHEPREVSEYSQPAPQPASPARDPHAGFDPHAMAHPPITPPLDEGEALKLNPHPDWKVQAARSLTVQVYALPAVEGDAEDADLAVSFLGQHIPLEMNVERWCGQFELPAGATCAEAARQRPLEGTKYPTTLVEIAGGFKGGGMFTGPGPTKPGYIMLVAEVRTPDKPWYLRLLGPEQTVRHWQDEFLRFAREAE